MYVKKRGKNLKIYLEMSKDKNPKVNNERNCFKLRSDKVSWMRGEEKGWEDRGDQSLFFFFYKLKRLQHRKLLVPRLKNEGSASRVWI